MNDQYNRCTKVMGLPKLLLGCLLPNLLKSVHFRFLTNFQIQLNSFRVFDTDQSKSIIA